MSRIMIVVEFEVKPEHRGDFVKLMKAACRIVARRGWLPAIRRAACRTTSDSRVFFIEAWRDQAALDVHSKVPRMAQNRETYTPWLQRPQGDALYVR